MYYISREVYIPTVEIKSSGGFSAVKAIAFLLLQVHAIFGAWLSKRTENGIGFKEVLAPTIIYIYYVPRLHIYCGDKVFRLVQ
jgi:hypothetical protein